MGVAPAICQIRLKNFRNYKDLTLLAEAPLIVLSGPNGAGKTNLLEAISFLTPGRGLRRAAFDQVANHEGSGDWTISVRLQQESLSTQIGTGLQVTAEGPERSRRIHINQAPATSSEILLDYLRLLWLTPAMDKLFTGPAGDRRRFLDRLILAIDPVHGKRVSAFERALTSRNRLLEQNQPDSTWLDAIERQISELGVAVALARRNLVARLQAYCRDANHQCNVFPQAELVLEGSFEALLGCPELRPAVDIEEEYLICLRNKRQRDAAIGRTLDGPHRSDFVVTHHEKSIPAALASTGEQKALLIGLILAHAQLVADQDGRRPILLLDEITAHLDKTRRHALFTALRAFGGQTWMTGTEPMLFDLKDKNMQHFHICDGKVEQASQ